MLRQKKRNPIVTMHFAERSFFKCGCVEIRHPNSAVKVGTDIDSGHVIQRRTGDG